MTAPLLDFLVVESERMQRSTPPIAVMAMRKFSTEISARGALLLSRLVQKLLIVVILS